jgi:hypothetical protein
MTARIVSSENRKWWTLAAVSVGLFMVMLGAVVAVLTVGRKPRVARERSVESDLATSPGLEEAA